MQRARNLVRAISCARSPLLSSPLVFSLSALAERERGERGGRGVLGLGGADKDVQHSSSSRAKHPRLLRRRACVGNAAHFLVPLVCGFDGRSGGPRVRLCHTEEKTGEKQPDELTAAAASRPRPRGLLPFTLFFLLSPSPRAPCRRARPAPQASPTVASAALTSTHGVPRGRPPAGRPPGQGKREGERSCALLFVVVPAVVCCGARRAQPPPWPCSHAPDRVVCWLGWAERAWTGGYERARGAPRPRVLSLLAPPFFLMRSAGALSPISPARGAGSWGLGRPGAGPGRQGQPLATPWWRRRGARDC